MARRRTERRPGGERGSRGEHHPGSERGAGGEAPRGAGLGEWASSLRFSGFTVLIVALVAIGALVVSPTLSAYVQQQRELAELRESVKLHREAVAEADAERLKWQDPAYVRAQARGRLFYVMPGEIQLSVIDDVVIPPESDEETSDRLTRIDRNWALALVSSTLHAGTTTASPNELLDRLLGRQSQTGAAVRADAGADGAEGSGDAAAAEGTATTDTATTDTDTTDTDTSGEGAE